MVGYLKLVVKYSQSSHHRAETSRPHQHEESKKTNKYAFCKPNVGLPYSNGGV